MTRNITIILLAMLVTIVPACKRDLDVPPMNIVTDDDVFATSNGVDAYMARIYSQIPMEDFKWNPTTGFRAFFYGSPSAVTGEAISRDQQNSTETFGYWTDAYILIRECNYLLQILPNYASNFNQTQVNTWLGEARFIRAFTYFALAKRYGGVPVIDSLLTSPGQSIEEVTANIEQYNVPRSSEETVYNSIGADLDYAFENLPATNTQGRATRYAAAALKSRAMLFAGSIAKYNTITLSSDTARVCGIPASRAVDYFKAAHDAATLLDGAFSLYKTSWSATDKAAQAANFAALFLDAASSENIFVRMYRFPDAVHWYDANQIPRQLWSGGFSAETNPTLDFVEMFEGLDKNPNGTLRTTDNSGNYLLFDNLRQPFENAEPRLRGTVLFPGDEFKGQVIELRRGIYTGPVAGGIPRLLPVGSTANYPTANLLSSASDNQTPYTLPDGSSMNPAGASGYFTNVSGVAGGISGFTIRKYLDPNKPTAEVTTNRSTQSWLELRYAEVLLNRAEAAYELYEAGEGANYQAQALTDINAIRERAGATPATPGDLSVDEVRMERRKELAFENKIWWDLKRWRVIDREQNGTIYRIINPIYAANAGKYFFDDRFDERNSLYTFDPRWYYQQIPQAIISRSSNLIQNPGY